MAIGNQNGIIASRIQLKSDTEENWSLIESTFVPLEGELILIYSTMENKEICRIKAGDGTTVLEQLPYIVGPQLKTQAIREVMSFSPGIAATANVSNHTLILQNGTAPTLISGTTYVATGKYEV